MSDKGDTFKSEITYNYGINQTGNITNYWGSASKVQFQQYKQELRALKQKVKVSTADETIKNEMLDAINEAQDDLDEEKPSPSKHSRVLELANRYNSVFGFGQLLVSFTALMNDIFPFGK